MSVAEFIFSRVAGLKPETLVKVNSFTGIFSEFCILLGTCILRNTQVAKSLGNLFIILSKKYKEEIRSKYFHWSQQKSKKESSKK